jgi:hypothetical protein
MGLGSIAAAAQAVAPQAPAAVLTATANAAHSSGGGSLDEIALLGLGAALLLRRRYAGCA